MHPQRYSTVPWLVNTLDLEEGRKFLWEIDYRRDEDRATCMAVLAPFQTVSEAYLVIHAIRGNGNDGGRITMALSDTPQFDVYAKEMFKICQRNPNRDGDAGDTEGD
jgi:hypothetical protein